MLSSPDAEPLQERLLTEYSFLTDENIHPHVVAMLRSHDIDVWDVKENQHQGTSDRELFVVANDQGRIILTHDSDFGALAVAHGLAWTGIIYMRPGLQKSSVVIENLEALFSRQLRPHVPFIIVLERKADRLNIRVR
jgi:predicted nuclease of predicted toxin-antitoxin system